MLKMKIPPVILYFLRNAPIWIPKSFFKKLDGITSSFVWSPKPPRIGLKVLQKSWGQGGLAELEEISSCELVGFCSPLAGFRSWGFSHGIRRGTSGII